MKNKIVILGAGSVGTVTGLALAEKYPDQVTLIGRAKHVNAVNVNGCRVTGKFEKTVAVRATEKIETPLHNTLLIVAVKITDLESSLREELPFMTATTSVLLLQNGYGVKDIANSVLEGTVPQERIYQAIATMGAVLKAPGLVEYFGGGLKAEKAFGESEYGGIFEDTFLFFKVTSDLDKAVFIKLVINSIANPLSVVFRANNNVIAEDRYNDIKDALLKEGLAVSDAEGYDIRLEVSDINKFISSDNRTSMLQDYFKKRHNEIDYINGALIRMAEEHGIEMPFNKMIVSIVKNIEKNRIDDKEETGI